MKLIIFGSVLAFAAAADTTFSIPTSLPSKADARLGEDINSFWSSVGSMPGWTSLFLVQATVSPKMSGFGFEAAVSKEEDKRSVLSVHNAILTANPAWLTALPKEQQTFVKSALMAEAEIFNKDVASSEAATVMSNNGLAIMGAVAAVILGLAVAL